MISKVLNEVLKPEDDSINERSQAALIKKHQNDVPTNKNLGFM
jgi:hypothetical protein